MIQRYPRLFLAFLAFLSLAIFAGAYYIEFGHEQQDHGQPTLITLFVVFAVARAFENILSEMIQLWLQQHLDAEEKQHIHEIHQWMQRQQGDHK